MAVTVTDVLARRGIAPAEDELNHYGIKGMKWGKRRSDAQIAAAKKKQDLSEMSDDDLKQKIARIKLEQEYSKLTTTTQGKSRVKAGGKYVAKELLKIGEQEAKQYLRTKGKDAVIEALKKQGAKKVAEAGLRSLTR